VLIAFSSFDVISSLKHPNVVAMMGYIVSPPVMVMELVPCGDLYGVSKTKTRNNTKSLNHFPLSVASS
jgi:hypothetical protein